MNSKEYEQLSEQEKAIVFATCAELEGLLAGISQKHKLKVVPAFLWDEMMDTIAMLKEGFPQLEEENEALKRAALQQGAESHCPTKAVRPSLTLCK